MAAPASTHREAQENVKPVRQRDGDTVRDLASHCLTASLVDFSVPSNALRGDSFTRRRWKCFPARADETARYFVVTLNTTPSLSLPPAVVVP